MLTSQSIWLKDVNESASAPRTQELMNVNMAIHAHALFLENSMPWPEVVPRNFGDNGYSGSKNLHSQHARVR